MLRAVRISIPILIALVGVVFFRDPVRVFAYQVLGKITPCTIAIPYRITYIDPRFGITEAEVIALLENAEKEWEGAFEDANLFTYADEPVLEISFVYDDRQATTEKLNELGVTISSSLESYNALKDAYESKRAAYLRSKSDFERRRVQYESAANAYETEVRTWNAEGGAPRAVHAELEAERRRLEASQAQLTDARNRLNASAADVNAHASGLNTLARELNIDAAEFNAEVSTQDEFEEAVYESAPGRQTVTVYEYDDRNRLQRVLTHEFGHALGIEHVTDEEAIMYSVNQGRGLELRPQDIVAVKAACRVSTS